MPMIFGTSYTDWNLALLIKDNYFQWGWVLPLLLYLFFEKFVGDRRDMTYYKYVTYSINDCTGEISYPPAFYCGGIVKTDNGFYLDHLFLDKENIVRSKVTGERIGGCSNLPDGDGIFRRGNACCSPQPEICKRLNGNFDKDKS